MSSVILQRSAKKFVHWIESNGRFYQHIPWSLAYWPEGLRLYPLEGVVWDNIHVGGCPNILELALPNGDRDTVRYLLGVGCPVDVGIWFTACHCYVLYSDEDGQEIMAMLAT